MTPGEFLQARMSLAARFRFRETSGYRSPKSNKRERGVEQSAHQYFLGVDVVLEENEPRLAFKIAAERLGLKALDEEDHVHLQPAGWQKG